MNRVLSNELEGSNETTNFRYWLLATALALYSAFIIAAHSVYFPEYAGNSPIATEICGALCITLFNHYLFYSLFLQKPFNFSNGNAISSSLERKIKIATISIPFVKLYSSFVTTGGLWYSKLVSAQNNRSHSALPGGSIALSVTIISAVVHSAVRIIGHMTRVSAAILVMVVLPFLPPVSRRVKHAHSRTEHGPRRLGSAGHDTGSIYDRYRIPLTRIMHNGAGISGSYSVDSITNTGFRSHYVTILLQNNPVRCF